MGRILAVIRSLSYRQRKGRANGFARHHFDAKSMRTMAPRGTWQLTLDSGAPFTAGNLKMGPDERFPIGRNIRIESEFSWKNRGVGENKPMGRICAKIIIFGGAEIENARRRREIPRFLESRKLANRFIATRG